VIIIDAVCQGDLQYSIDGGKTYQHLNAFMNLAPGTYTIKVKSAGCEKEYDKVIVLTCENDNGDGKGSLSGKAFKSCSDSGIKGSSKGLAGVKVTLTSSTGATLNTTTSATGTYNFANVDAGTYTVTFEKANGFDFAKANQGNDDTNDSDVDASGKTSVTIAANQLVDNVDAGFKDIQAPSITFIHPLLVGKKDGETVYMECGFEEVLKATDAKATDNCDVNPIVKMEDGTAILSKECDKDGYLVKMQCGWIATDECGNKTQIWLDIVVRDTKAPDLVGVPSNVTISDKDVVPTAPTVLAKDKCDKDAKVIFAENKSGNVITRTWTASDACGNKTTATQTITITTTTNNPCTISLAPVPVTYPSTCAGKDGKAKLTPSTYTYKWADGIIGDTRLDLDKGIYTVTATDANGCTLAFKVEIKDGCTQATYKFASKGEIRQVACGVPQKDYCLDVDYVDFMLNYNLTSDGVPLNGKIKPCTTVLHGEYSLSGLINTSLSVENWVVDGQNISFDFTDLNDLVTKMNQYDSNGGWKLNPLDATLENDNFKKNRYGNLTIGKKQLGLQWIIQVSEFSLSKGINFMVEGMGKHEIVMRHKASNATDTMRVQFVCTTPTLFDVVLQEGDIKGIDIATTELVGAKCVIENHDDALFNKAAMFHNSGKRPTVINVEGMHQGAKQVMFTMCDEHNICDTATIRVIVYAKEKVIVEKDKTIKIFTGFSPNEDGVNDVFTIENIEYHPENTLTVFNRFGNVVYSKEGYENTWQGTFGNKNLPDGTYFYHLEIKGQKTRSGYVELRR
jgi:gliding motility-associated-like protein